MELASHGYRIGHIYFPVDSWVRDRDEHDDVRSDRHGRVKTPTDAQTDRLVQVWRSGDGFPFPRCNRESTLDASGRRRSRRSRSFMFLVSGPVYFIDRGPCGLEKSLLELVKLRASQINGCAYCLDMHSKDALAAGETPQGLVVLDAWRETPFYTDRERAALTWCEAVTRISETHAPDEAFQAAREHFNEVELVNLTLAITAINTWNRIAISFRSVPGTYQPRPAA
jgi:AhpD family alkylhydroperoxidase